MSVHKVKEALQRLAIGEDRFRAIALIPLVEVAWADGRVQLGERLAVRRFAKRKGWLVDGGHELVEAWLGERPSEAFFEEARTALRAIVADRRGLGSAFPEDTLKSVLVACHDVAMAAGGLFGLRGSIAPEEASALHRIATTFELGSWEEAAKAAREAEAEVRPLPGPQGDLLLGSARDFNRDAIDFLFTTFRQHGDIARTRFGPVECFVISHPEGVKRVLQDNHRNYRLSPAIEVLKEFIGDGMFTIEGEPWRRHRRIAQPAFHMQALTGMAETMTRVTSDDLPLWLPEPGSREPVDFMARFMQLALRIAGVTLFGVDLARDADAVSRAAEVALAFMTDRTRSMIRLPLGVPTEANRKFLEARGVLDELIYRLVGERRAGKVPDRPDLLQMLLDARDEETGEGFSDRELRDELLTVLGAGHETTALAMMWTCYFLAKYPPVRRAVEQEIAAAIGDRAAPVLSDLPKMPLMKRVIDESLRLRPPFWAGGRLAVAEDVVCGARIPPGATILLGIYSMHRHPEFWPDPEGFDPDRFREEAVKARHPTAFAPFGAGPKKCIGINFATMELQLVLPMVIRAYEFALLPGLEPKPLPGLTLRARDGCWMTLRKR